ncbi:DUF2269 domain-containing protein [Devosia sp. ZB163]|uniref:DUF2269 family protein n=1 Tax=Devosia sp. ZB163 TaxID=3025938 RepID=UPI0023617D30|nr:DUF2269 domain-containing protein [Devosia sp. ZB163]MDC9824450.1 DUF2269 domain-containing protein [Devosia sp. ZB163]
MDPYLVLKWVHILSSTVLFGLGAGTAYYFWMAHLSRDARTIATVGSMVVTADWIFTGTSGIVQPVSGLLLAVSAGYDLGASWLVATYILYAIAFACWAPVVWLRIRARDLASAAAAAKGELPPEYFRVMRLWFALGWPAFIGLAGTFWLMVAKPDLW